MPLFGPPDIGKMEKAGDAKGLVKALSYRDVQIRAQAAHALCRVRDGRAVEPLVASLQDPEANVRAAAAWALAEQGDLRAVDPLIAALKDENELVRKAAAQAWTSKKLPDKSTRAVDAFITSLRDPSADIRWLAASALGILGDERAVEPLKALLESPSGGVVAGGPRASFQVPEAKADDIRKQIIEALKAIGGPRATQALAESGAGET